MPAPHRSSGSAYQGKKLIVEVGHGQNPVWRTLRKLPLLDQSYLGLDIDARCWPSERMPLYDLEEGRGAILARAQKGHDCRFMTISFDGMLPLRDAIATEVYLSLVANDPRILGQVVERLLHESCRILEPKGHLVIDNGAILATDSGDILVDGDPPRIKFKLSRGSASAPEDYANANTLFLNDAFHPMAHGLYRHFLGERGYPPHFQLEPGLSFSILMKK